MFGLSDCDVHSVVPLAVPLVWTHSQGTRPTRHRHWALAIAARHRPSPSAYGDRVTVTTLSCTISPQTITPAAGAPVTWWSSPPPPLPPSVAHTPTPHTPERALSPLRVPACRALPSRAIMCAAGRVACTAAPRSASIHPPARPPKTTPTRGRTRLLARAHGRGRLRGGGHRGVGHRAGGAVEDLL